MTEPIAATTDNGTGLILPITKALTHVMSVYTAIAREWPMTAADAQAELEEAKNHLAAATIPEELMTRATVIVINDWKNNLNAAANAIDIATEQPLAEAVSTEQLKSLATDTWQLICQLELELTGLTVGQVDPGRMP